MEWLDILNWTDKELKDLNFLAYSYFQQGKYEIAIKFFKALTILDIKNPFYLQMLGALYLETEKNEEALNYLNKSLELQSNHFPSLLNKAKVLINLGKKKDGIILAKRLATLEDKKIKSQAEAIILAHF